MSSRSPVMDIRTFDLSNPLGDLLQSDSGIPHDMLIFLKIIRRCLGRLIQALASFKSICSLSHDYKRWTRFCDSTCRQCLREPYISQFEGNQRGRSRDDLSAVFGSHSSVKSVSLPDIPVELQKQIVAGKITILNNERAICMYCVKRPLFIRPYDLFCHRKIQPLHQPSVRSRLIYHVANQFFYFFKFL